MTYSEDTLDMQEELKALQDSYIAGFPDKIKTIENTWQGVVDRVSKVEELHMLVHRLTGSGASYGFYRISERARNLELYLKAIIHGGFYPNTPQITDITGLINRLKTAHEEDEQEYQYSNIGIVTKPRLDKPLLKTLNRPIYVIIDDVEAAQELIKQLSHFGYIVQNFNQVSDFYKIAKLNLPSAVIIDFDLLNHNNAWVQAIKQINQADHEPVPILFLSNEGDIDSRLHAVRMGGKAYFTKPININELVDKLDILATSQELEPYRILIIEDDPSLANYYSITLHNSGMVTSVITNPMEVMKPLVEFGPDLILMDIYMPGCSGLELASVIRQQEAYLSIPIVFLSAETDLNTQMNALLLGGDDFLMKPIQPLHLISSISARAQRSRILRSIMVRDSLTGLYNHTTIKEFLLIEVTRAYRHNRKCSFAIIDIDHFKAVNDTFGHPNGDRVIKSLSRLLKQRLRKTDVIGRYGGEEFAVILPDTDGANAAKIMEEICTGFKSIHHFPEWRDKAVTLSCGVATFPSYMDAVALTEAADRALYLAKNNGRDRVVLL